MSIFADDGNAPPIKIEIKELKEDSMQFYLLNCDTALANSFRRVMIAEVPTLAIDLVEIQENSSVLHDELLSHRLGMIPLRVEKHPKFPRLSSVEEYYNFKRDCNCDDSCPQCSVRFQLDASNDGPDDIKIVYSSDLVPINEGRSVTTVDYASEEQRMLDGDDAKGIAICKLGKGQRLKLEATAVKGFSKIHAKWAAVCATRYAVEADIILNEENFESLTNAQKLEFVESCPVKVYSFDERQQKVVIEESEKCMFCEECVKLSEKWKLRKDDDPFVQIAPIPNRYLFTIETTGSLSPEEIVFSALRRLKEKLSVVRERIDRDMEEEEENITTGPYIDQGGFM